MSKLNPLQESSVIVDLTRFEGWEEASRELTSLIKTRRSFWGDTSLVLRFNDFLFLEENAVALKELILSANISISQIQTNSVRSWKALREKGFQVDSIPYIKVSPISGSGIRLIRETKVKDSPPLLPTILPHNSFEGKTAYVGTMENIALRAGKQISYDGNLVIIGDVNPGCQIKLTGSIIVYGKLCGSVHAGFGITDGDEVQKIFVKAHKMGDPLQISIGEYSACSSNLNEADAKQKIYPETARVIEGRIWRISDYE
jgi:septum formation inhibitor MinC